MSSNDLVVASTVDVATFRASRLRAFLMMFNVAGAAWFLVRAACMLLIGGVGLRPTAGDLVALVTGTMGYATTVATLFVLVTWRRLPWVRVSAGGLALSATGRDVVVLPWSDVESVGLRRYGPLTQLVVTPTAGRAAPAAPDRTARRGGVVVVDVATLHPSPATLLAEIRGAATARS